MLVDGLNPVARSNLAIALNPVAEPALYGFSYTVPATRTSTTFLVAGTPEVRARAGMERDIVAHGDVSPATGRKMHFTRTTVLRVKDGKIAEEIGLDDGVTAL